MVCHRFGEKKQALISLCHVLQPHLEELCDRTGHPLLQPVMLWLKLHRAPPCPAQVPKWAYIVEG